MKRKVTPQILKEIILLKKKGTKISEISTKFNLSDRTINKYSKKIPHPNKKSIISNPASAKKLTKHKSELLGFLCSEGNDNDYTDNYMSYDPRRNKSYLRKTKREWINFSNTDLSLQNRFIFLMNKVYDYPLKVYKKGTIYLKRKEVVKDLRKYTLFGSKKWKVPNELFDKKYENQAKYFIRSFVDGDGTIDLVKKSVIIDSTNKNSLKEMSNLLKKLKINNKYYDFKNGYRIVIKDVRTYKKLIGCFHCNKKEKLNIICK